MRFALQLFILGAVFTATGARTSASADSVSVAQALLDAVAKQDVTALATLSPTLALAHVWFDSPECAKKFSSANVVMPWDRAAFLKCLATLDLKIAPAGKRAEISDVETLTFEPGGELTLGTKRGVLIWMSVFADDGQDLTALPVTPRALNEHRMAGGRAVVVEPSVLQAIAKSPHAVAYVYFQICIDRLGKPEIVTITRSSTEYSGFAENVKAFIATSRYQPFLRHGTAVRVCGPSMTAYPPDRIQYIPPAPPRPPAPPSPSPPLLRLVP